MRLRRMPTDRSAPSPQSRSTSHRSVVLVAILASGCFYVDSDPPPETVVVTSDPMVYEEVVVIENSAPYIITADAGCYYEPAYRDELWYFEADVDDADSPFDVVAVYADVYDDFTGAWVDSFELYPTDDPYFWISDWAGSTTYLDCRYGGYVVDFVAYDSFDAMDIISVYPWTYSYY